MDNPYTVDLQIACTEDIPVSETKLFNWINLTLKAHKPVAELTVRFVDKEEITELNNTYRKKNKPTNVLAFPSNIPEYIDLEYPFLGDIIVCPKVLKEEYLEQQIAPEAHWAHIIIHGVLHLLGYDHIIDADANKMQAMETQLLAHLGFANPYAIED